MILIALRDIALASHWPRDEPERHANSALNQILSDSMILYALYKKHL